MEEEFGDIGDLNSDDYLDDGSIKDLSNHYRSFSFERTNSEFGFVPDRDYMFDFLAALDYEPAEMSNEEIEYEYTRIMEGSEDE